MLVPKLAGPAASTPRQTLAQPPKRRLFPRRRPSSNSGVPSPADQAVFAHVMDEGRHIAVAVAFRVFDLPANLGEQFAVPRHGERREVPFWVAGHAGRTEITFVMAGRACHARCAVPVRTTHDQRLMRTHSVRLRRTIARRMAIHATRVLQHLTGFLKQRDRTRALVLDRLEARNRAELCAFLSRALAECGGEANRNHRRCDGKQQREPWTHHATPCTIGRPPRRCKPSRATPFSPSGPISGPPAPPTPVEARRRARC